MRRQIATEHGIGLVQFMGQLRGTVGDPSIGDKGLATAQTGITIQQAYSLKGVHIGIDGIRQARSANQNIGLDKMHTYLRLRPKAHPRGALPWWQITEDCTPLIDEIKTARKPRQTQANKEVRNASEEIRDKDNHAIDAAKYLFIVTHDLRPAQYRTLEASEEADMTGFLQAVPTQAVTHNDIHDATMASGSRSGPWSVYGSDSYYALEE